MTLATVDADGYPRAVSSCSGASTSAASPSSPTTKAPRAGSWRPILGGHDLLLAGAGAARCASKAASRRSLSEESDAYYRVQVHWAVAWSLQAPGPQKLTGHRRSRRAGTAKLAGRPISVRRPAAELSRALGASTVSCRSASRVLGRALPSVTSDRLDLSTPGRRLVARTPGALSPPCFRTGFDAGEAAHENEG